MDLAELKAAIGNSRSGYVLRVDGSRGLRVGKGGTEARCRQDAGGTRGSAGMPVDWCKELGTVRCDSRKVEAGDVFVAVRGVHVDGHDYVPEALGRGAKVIVAERPMAVGESAELVLTANSAAALGELAQLVWGEPSRQLITLGVTGTNGKTTVAYLTQAMMKGAGKGCGLLGTVIYDVGSGVLEKSDNTTPDAVRVAELMGRMCANGLKAVVMECSSHGLDQQRTAGIEFAAAAFTNLTGDHLDYHGNRQAYQQAKSRLFGGLGAEAVAVLNGADEASEAMAAATGGRVWRYGMDGPWDIRGQVQREGLWGTELVMDLLGQAVRVRLPLVGRHNVSNFLAAAGLAHAAGLSGKEIAEAAEGFAGVPGRLERVDEGQGCTVLVDYAHTDDALQHALATVRGLCAGQVIVVFGCGGDRDRTKRPRMARVAEEWADQVVVTNDNPRTERPEDILAEIRAGFSPAMRAKVKEIPDRQAAIEYAIGAAGPKDVVLIAGKGHEDYQLVGRQRLAFDDRQVAREAIGRRGV